MVHRNTSKQFKAKTILRLPDLQQSKTAVLHSLGATSSQESYGHAIDEFIGWYCSEPRLAFKRTVVSIQVSFSKRESCTFHDQRLPGRRAAVRIRSLRRWPSEPGTGRRHPPRQRSKTSGRADWQLVDR